MDKQELFDFTASRRQILMGASLAAGALGLAACSKKPTEQAAATTAASAATAAVASKASSDEVYIWISANKNLPLFVAHDHPALKRAAEDLGVQVKIQGTDTVDIPGLVNAVDTAAVTKPAGIMVIGWDPKALIPAIDNALKAGIPVVCLDADVPGSKRLTFVGTDWFNIGVNQGNAMLAGLKAAGKSSGKIALMGLVALDNQQTGFRGFKSVMEPAGFTVMEPKEDKGNQEEAAKVASAILQGNPDLVGIAGFDSESGPGIGIAIREANKSGKLAATTTDAEANVLKLIKEGALTAGVGQLREVFSYFALMALYDYNHSPMRKISKFADVIYQTNVPLPIRFPTGSYIVDKSNVDAYASAV